MPESVLTDQLPASPNGQAPAVITPALDEEVCSWVDGLFEEAAKRRKEDAKEESWEAWEDQYWGHQWPASLPSYKPAIVANELKMLIQQEVSDLTENPIKIFVQKDRTKADRDENVEKAIQAFWLREHCDYQVMLATLNAAIKPCGFLSCTYDPGAEQGQGKVLVRSRSPRSVYPDGDAVDDDRWRYVILSDVLDLVEIRRLWPHVGEKVRPDSGYSIKANPGMTERLRTWFHAGSKYHGPLYAPGPGGVPQGYIKARAEVLTVFIYDEEIEQDIEEITDPTTGEPSLKTKTRQKYPNGRMIQTANGVVLFDGPNPYHGRFPVVRVTLQLTPETFWPPQSMVADTMELQMAADKLDSLVVENGIRLNNGEVIADANSGIKPGKYTRTPGAVTLKTPGSSVEIRYPPQMPADMVNGGERLRGIQRRVQGFPQSRTGEGQRGNISAELTETEISQAQGLSRLRARLLYMSVQKTVEMIFQRMAQYYLVPRHIPFIANEKWDPVPWQPITDPSSYSVHLDPSSFQVRSRTMMQRLYLTLAKFGKMPTDELLKMLEIPDAERIAAKLNQELFLQAMAKGKIKPGKGR
jgi:hypothetical protein